MLNGRGEQIIVDEVDAASLVRNPNVRGVERQRASHVMGRGDKLFHPSGRLIRSEAEATAMMQLAYSADVAGLHALMKDHELDMNLLHGNDDHSLTRDFAQLLYTVATVDPKTNLQDRLKLSSNKQLQGRLYDSSDHGGGFVAHETKITPHTEKEKKAIRKGKTLQRDTTIPQNTGRNIEFHPPAEGSQHTTQPFGSLHGAYLRPANQPNVKKGRERAFSSGPSERG